MKYYTNPQMLSPEALHEAHLEMAKNYLESKWDSHYYELVPEQYECEYEDYDNYEEIQEHNRSYYRKLTDDQFSRVCTLMKGAEKPTWYDALSDDTELQELLTSDYDGNYPASIIDIPHQYCDCFLGVMDSTGQMSSYNLSVLMPKDDYLKLLVIMMDHRWATFNDLYRLDIDFFKSIADIIDHEVKSNPETHKTSYTIVFDEIERDIQSLLGEEDCGRCLYNSEEDGWAAPDKIIKVFVMFSENKMSVWYSVMEPYNNKDEVLYNIDAKAVMKVLHVDNYHDALVVIEDRFRESLFSNPFSKIKEFLDKQEIGYEYSFEVTD